MHVGKTHLIKSSQALIKAPHIKWEVQRMQEGIKYSFTVYGFDMKVETSEVESYNGVNFGTKIFSWLIFHL